MRKMRRNTAYKEKKKRNNGKAHFEYFHDLDLGRGLHLTGDVVKNGGQERELVEGHLQVQRRSALPLNVLLYRELAQ